MGALSWRVQARIGFQGGLKNTEISERALGWGVAGANLEVATLSMGAAIWQAQTSFACQGRLNKYNKNEGALHRNLALTCFLIE